MNHFEININEFDISDNSYLWMWRNDPLTMEMFVNKKKVSWFESTCICKKIRTNV